MVRALLALLFSLPVFSVSQERSRNDSATVPLLPSSISDTTRIDSLHPGKDTASVSGVDTLVSYSSADSIVYSIGSKMMSMYEKGNIKYRDMELKSDRININWNTSVMAARGVADTSDTTGKTFRGTPEMKDGGEDYHGSELGYNFKTKRGRISVANTQIDEGYYHGETIKKVDKDVLFVGDGRYTTCDAPEPHYFIFSPKMKVTVNDKVVAEPVFLYVADVPVFWLPFGVFPNQRGRRSGIIAPAYGEDGIHGRFLHHLGYYFAISDYMDINLVSDLYTKGSWAFSSLYRYSLRYYFTGSISGDYKKFIEGDRTDPQYVKSESYNIHITHNQTIDPTTNFNVNFTFANSNSYRNTVDLNQALQQFITSNATISHSWEGTPNSISLNVSRTQNLINENVDEILPSLSFNHSQSFPFRWGKSDDGDESDRSWLEDIGFSYGAQITNHRSKVSTRIDSIKTNINGADTIHSIQDFAFNRDQTLSQSASLNLAPKLGYITLSPFLNYNDVRTFINNDVPTLNRADSTLQTNNVRQSRRSGVLSAGLGASTKLYAIVQPGFFGIAALRHTLSPRLSFTYQKQVIGPNPYGKQMFMSFNVGNLFEMKTISHEEGKEGEKIQLLNLDAGISYNFSIDSLNFSPIGLSYRTSIGTLLDIGGSANFDLYKLVEIAPNYFTKVNKFLINEEGRLARLTNFSISLSTSLAGEKNPKRQSPPTDSLQPHQQRIGAAYGMFQDEEPDFSIPWRLSLSLDYSEVKVPPFPVHAANVRGSLEFNLTENWKFTMSGGYDVTNKEITVPNINISRDLHCWLMNFSWVPTGPYRHYMLEIRVKASQLQDLKVTKSGSERGIY